MNLHPIATLHMANGSKIVLELLPEAAPNTVNSFIYAASRGFMDHHAIQRIVPGNWVDVTYQAFGHKKCQYLIPNEFELHPEIEPLDSHPGCVCMGGYGEDGLASCEFFFPLRDCPDHKGVYPVFGKVIEGMDEIWRLEKVKTRPVDFPIPGVEVNEPVEPEVIEKVVLDLKGKDYPEPVRMKEQHLHALLDIDRRANMFYIREMKSEDKSVIMPMVITFYHSPAVEHDVDTAVLERTFDAATDAAIPSISGIVMMEDEKVVGYGYVTGYYATEVGGLCMFMEEMYFTPECRGKGYGTKAYQWIVEHYPEYKRFRIEVTESNKDAKRLYERWGFRFLEYNQMVLDR